MSEIDNFNTDRKINKIIYYNKTHTGHKKLYTMLLLAAKLKMQESPTTKNIRLAIADFKIQLRNSELRNSGTCDLSGVLIIIIPETLINERIL